MKRSIINYTTSLALTVIFIFIGITGILIFPGFLQFFGINLNALPKVQIYKFHHWFGLLMIGIISIHGKLHWTWISGMIKRLFSKNKISKLMSQRNIANFLITISLIIPYSLVILTGVIKFPGFLQLLGADLLSFPINEISIIHEWSGIIAIFLTVVHLILHRKWFISIIKQWKRHHPN